MLLVQDGHQTHTRASEALDAGYAGGVIWSPGDHRPDHLSDCIRSDHLEGTAQAIDPQLYVARLSDSNPKKLAEYKLFPIPMGPRDLAARLLPDLVNRILDFQAGHEPLTHFISPTLSVPSMADRKAQSASDLADASLAWKSASNDNRPLLLSLALERSLLEDEESIDGILDEATSFDADGYYLLFELPPELDRERSAVLQRRALYIVSALAANDYEVWVGYAGVGSYAMRAAGASVVASAWFQKQQWWSPDHWTGSGFGRQPKPRAFLSSTIGSLLLEDELDPLRRVDQTLYAEVLDSPGPIADELRAGRSPADGEFGRPECSQQLFATLADLESRFSGDMEADVARAIADLRAATDLVTRVNDLAPLDSRSGPRSVGAWVDATEGLASDLGFDV